MNTFQQNGICKLKLQTDQIIITIQKQDRNFIGKEKKDVV